MDDNLERILEEGIRGYASAEPLSGMEERILARIRVVPHPRGHVNGWLPALALGLAGLSLLLVLPRRKEPPQPVNIATAIEPQPIALKETVKVSRVDHLRSRVKLLPKLAVFPTPLPLTGEERRLMALVDADPKGTAEAFESLRKRIEPLDIPPLVIEPLNNGEEQERGKL